MEFTDESISMVATDGRCLAHQVFPAEKMGDGAMAKVTEKAVIPVRTMKFMERVISDVDPMVDIQCLPSGSISGPEIRSIPGW